MSTASPEAWSISKWFAMIGSLIGVQALLVFLFSERETLPEQASVPPPAVYYLGPGWDELPMINRVLARDASLLSRPHGHSFTGALWEEALAPERDYKDWTEEPRYFQRNQYTAGAALRAHTREQVIPGSVVSRSIPELSSAELPPPLQPRESSFVVTGEIQNRRPREFESLPAWSHTNLVQPTVISVALDQFGWAHSVLMVSNSLPLADAHARQWLRQTQFESLPARNDGIDPGLSWGEITFRWATRPLTNAVPASAPIQ